MDELQLRGLRALDSGDAATALDLLERASARDADRFDGSLELSIIWTLFQTGRMEQAAARAGTAASRAAAAGDVCGQLRAELARLYLMSHLDPATHLEELEDLLERGRPTLEASGDHAALGSLWLATWALEHFRCRFGAAANAARRTVEHARAAGETYIARWAGDRVGAGLAFGPTPVTEVLAWLDEQEASLSPQPTWIDFWRFFLLPLIGRFDAARQAHKSDLRQLTDRDDQLGLALASGWEIEMQAGQFAEAERVARRSCQLLDDMGERAFWSTKACELAQALYCLGRYEEAETWARQAADVGASSDIMTQLMACQVLAKTAARLGRRDAAMTMADQVQKLAAGMEAPVSQGDACLDAGETFWLLGDVAAARAQARRAAEFYEVKGASVPLERARRAHHAGWAG